MYFIHKLLTNMFGPKQVGKNFVNKIYNKFEVIFVGYLCIMDSKKNFKILWNKIQNTVTAT